MDGGGQDGQDETFSMQALDLPEKFVGVIENVVGLLQDNCFVFVFVDKALWVCTAPLEEEGSITRHFFIPHD